ncbi:MAG: hypothetical protein A3H98_08280 [Bacteroidetes bacterium RIFCSPLOWO2_02_FULL_36_8]|nr:MAG: hypothetical protein A3H98_08280 [Bacteroidetes bacterium RIFCSPLOWO2_02_FULL_36_8]OFY68895.1 MAG: hypothetical protein A3G23_03695 [Bacteroidetes bacterium RIFCSPLOWO2_12_FULL_37_12]
MVQFLVSSILFVLLSTPAYTQSTHWPTPIEFINLQNPFPSNENSINNGNENYQLACAPCHGTGGLGNGPASVNLNPPPANHTSKYVQRETDGGLFWKISEGKGSMPAWKTSFTEEERWNLVNYIRTLADPNSTDTLPRTAVAVNRMESSDDNKSQTTSSQNNKFLITGSANTEVIADGSMFNTWNFGTGFQPLFLWRPSEKLFFESHLHLSVMAQEPESEHAHSQGTQNSSGESHDGGHATSGAEIMLGYANLVYFPTKTLTLTAGYFLSPMGIFTERMHPEWINRFPNTPLGFGHSGNYFPESDIGVQLRGTLFDSDYFEMIFSGFISNGPALIDTGFYAGKLNYSNLIDNNSSKAVGGRIGFIFPSISHLEIGLSGANSPIGKHETNFESVTALLSAADFSWTTGISSLSSQLTFRGQLSSVTVDDANYFIPASYRKSVKPEQKINDSTYTYQNKLQMLFFQASLRPVEIMNSFFKNIEFAFRYDQIQLPEMALWSNSDMRLAFGINYWFTARSLFKISYQTGEHKNLFYSQWVIGF